MSSAVKPGRGALTGVRQSSLPLLRSKHITSCASVVAPVRKMRLPQMMGELLPGDGTGAL